MSDLYLVLRHRVTDVAAAQWAELGTQVMRDARQERGLSYESVSRLLHVSSKTYERYEKRGAVPVGMVDQVAEVLGLQIERADPRPTVVKIDGHRESDVDALRAAMQEGFGSIRESIEALAEQLARLERPASDEDRQSGAN